MSESTQIYEYCPKHKNDPTSPPLQINDPFSILITAPPLIHLSHLLKKSG